MVVVEGYVGFEFGVGEELGFGFVGVAGVAVGDAEVVVEHRQSGVKLVGFLQFGEGVGVVFMREPSFADQQMHEG